MNQLAHTYMQSRNDTYVMELAIQYIRRNYPKPITLAMVSNEVSLNYAYFSTMFSKYTGKTFSEYLPNTPDGEGQRAASSTGHLNCRGGRTGWI